MNKKIKKIISDRLSLLNSLPPTLETLYKVSFSAPEYVMAETNDGIFVTKYTYGEIKDKIESAAGGIYAAIGATHSFVGIEIENSVDWIVAFWAVLKSGNKPYLINLRHPEKLSNRIIENLKIKKIICTKAGSLNAEYIELSSLEGECPDCFENEIAIASSGTSLSETVCFYSGANICAQIHNTKAIVQKNKSIYAHYKGELKQLAFLPFYHIFGLFAVYFWFTFFGRTLVFLRDMSSKTILFTCKEHSVTHIFGVPMLWHTIEDKVIKGAEKQNGSKKLNKALDFCTRLQALFPSIGVALSKRIMKSVTKELFGNSLLFCVSGGSFLRSSALHLINALGYPLHNGYGMSEIGIAAVCLDKNVKDRNKNSVGEPLSSVEFKIDGDGVLWVKGASLCSKTLKDGQEALNDGWFCTGDICSADSFGRYYIKGRVADTVIGEDGENLNPDIIEQYFSSCGADNMSVLGLNDKLTLIAQVSPYASASRIEDIRKRLEAVNRELPVSQQIKAFYMTSDAIMSPGAVKVSRKALALWVEEGSVKLSELKKEQIDNGFNISSPLAEKVIEILCSQAEINAEGINPDGNLFTDFNLTSLQYFSFISALSEEFGIEFTGEEDYCYTVREFCEYIERQL